MSCARFLNPSITKSVNICHFSGFGSRSYGGISGKSLFGSKAFSFSCFTARQSQFISARQFYTWQNGCHGCRAKNLNPKQFSGLNYFHSSSRLHGSLRPTRWKKLQNYILTFIRRNSNKVEASAESSPPKKGTPSLHEVKRLLSLAKPEKWKLAAAIFLLVISSTVSMSVPFCIGKVIDTIYNSLQEKDGLMEKNLTFICKILLGIFFLGAAANFGRVYLINISGSNIIKRLREKLFASIMRQEVGFFDKTKTGEVINRLSTDASIVGTSITNNISDGLRALAQGIGGVCMMLVVSPKLTGIALMIVPPLIVMSRIYGSYVRKITKQVQDSLAGATQVAEERISNIRTVRSFAQEQREIEKYNEKITHILKLAYKESLARGVFWASTGLSGNIIILSVFYYGGLMMQDSAITVGDLSAFLLYAAYSGFSISGLTSFYTEMMRGLGASSRLWYLTDREPEIPIAGGLIPQGQISGNIEFKDIAFSYPTREEVAIFTGLNMVVPAGSMTAVVGASGSGKSTIGSLLLRLYDPNEGSITLDGHDIRKLDPMWLRHQIGTVSQEPTLFSCTIAENIMYGAHDPAAVTRQEIENAARKANALNFIQGFPENFDTLVGERGIMLSGGQKQRIAIARAILKNPKILLLDEATSALDAESEYLVQDALEHLMVGRTVITIAHRLSTIKSADQIAVIDKGRIAEIGSYQQLMTIPNGLFKKLVERQTITQ